MPLTLEEVEHIADLARLSLTDEEKEQFRQQLSAVLDYAGRLEELDTEAIPPSATVLPKRSVMRPDQACPSPPRDDILTNAPSAEEGCFLVPAVLTTPSEPEE